MDLRIKRRAIFLRVQVEDNLRAAIITGRFSPGERLVERELCDLLGVSRPSVREALRQLEAEGLIVNARYRGPVVATINAEDARQIYEVRALLEGLAGRGFVTYGPKKAVTRLGAALRSLNRAAQNGSVSDGIAAANRFYDTLLNHCGNAIAQQILQHLRNRINLLRGMSMSMPGRAQRSAAEIAAILQAIEACDAEAAAKACEMHVRNAAEAALKILAEREHLA